MPFVQFLDEKKTSVVAVFGCPQDPAAYPHQDEVDDSDPRYLAFCAPTVEQQNAPIKAQLVEWDAKAGRAMLEALLALDVSGVALPAAILTRLQEIEAHKETLRGQLK